MANKKMSELMLVDELKNEDFLIGYQYETSKAFKVPKQTLLSSIYMGQLKYGANTVTDRDAITGMAADDICAVQGTPPFYKYTGSAWEAQSREKAAVGQYYDILFWYGMWDGTLHKGDVSARITCADASTPQAWDLIVYDDKIMNGEIAADHLADKAVTTAKLADGAVTAVKLAMGSVSDGKLGNRELDDNNSASSLIPIGAKTLTAWLQGIRNNLKYLFESKANNTIEVVTQETAEAEIMLEDIPVSFYWMFTLLDNPNRTRTVEIHQKMEHIIFYLQVYNRTSNEITLQFRCPDMIRRQSDEPITLRPDYSVEISYIVIEGAVTITSSAPLTTYQD